MNFRGKCTYYSNTLKPIEILLTKFAELSSSLIERPIFKFNGRHYVPMIIEMILG